MKKYLYEVRPVKPVITPEGRSTRRPFSSLLSKEEVMGYMRSCSIYRRFSNAIAPVRVTGSNLDELHRDSISGTIIENEKIAEVPLDEKPNDIDYVSFDKPNEELPIEEPTENVEVPVEQEQVAEESVDTVEEKVETEIPAETTEETVEQEQVAEETTDVPVEVNVEPVVEEPAENVESEEKVETPVEEQAVEATEVNGEVEPVQNDQNRDAQTTKNIQVNYNKNKHKR